ncbi:hypothetical protein BDV23DRAFT_153265 [Aspergillus alliaceus]|uniref:Pectate lyase superfamily protein domain-containing protein n=1 Tax=Petromyces alliaceus TaxID=209559 RepID=A0A5N7CC04_PETAA|nr:hypothetical protein BDV23DRAFT_153265 [Aspergillus alliaceus]
MRWLVVAPLLLGLSSIGHVSQTDSKGKICTVKANGNQEDEVRRLLKAFQECGNGGIVIFPEDQSYWIASHLNPILSDVTVE